MGCDILKIEKISDSQIRCTLNRADLQSRKLKISELAYGTEKAKDLFHDMIEQASHQFGFVTDDLPLMIEAIPISPDCIILNITKVEDPEELDSKLAQFELPDEDVVNDSPEDDLDLSNIFDLAKELHNDSDDIAAIEDIFKKADNFIPIKDTLEMSKMKEEKKLPEKVPVLFSFESYNMASKAIAKLKYNPVCESTLFKNTKDSTYLLYILGEDGADNDFMRLCNELTEYGKKEPVSYSSFAYLSEHCETIIRSNAIEILKKY